MHRRREGSPVIFEDSDMIVEEWLGLKPFLCGQKNYIYRRLEEIADVSHNQPETVVDQKLTSLNQFSPFVNAIIQVGSSSRRISETFERVKSKEGYYDLIWINTLYYLIKGATQMLTPSIGSNSRESFTRTKISKRRLAKLSQIKAQLESLSGSQT